MTKIEFNIKKDKIYLLELLEKHEGFGNRSEMFIHYFELGLQYNSIQHSKIQHNKNAINGNDLDSKALKLADDLLYGRKNARTIVRDLDAKKTTPEIVTYAVWHIEGVLVDVKGTRELESMMNVVEKEIVTKKDAKSLRKYDTIMKICPDRIRRSIKKMREDEEIERRRIERQTKIPQYPEPELTIIDGVTYNDDELEPYDENEQEPEEMNEKDLIAVR